MAATHSSLLIGNDTIKCYSADVPIWELNSTNVPTYASTMTSHTGNVTTAHGRDTLLASITPTHTGNTTTAHGKDVVAQALADHIAVAMPHGYTDGLVNTTWEAGHAWAGGAARVELYKIAHRVLLYITYNAPSDPGAADTARLVATTIPVAFRPAAAMILPIWVLDNTAGAEGRVTVGADGSIIIGVGATSAAFTNGFNGQAGCIVTYHV